ncbi:hypothetical protein GGR95_001645 [Sulfitobacter undariae]|uniref:Tetratricopeptide repeat-containing protein n=1 Tax=Sulfitobacter undariae TaxID=1563671 RepID=A0A7W6E9Y7_9RHOB|nr:hypothetical protein [Sulfitobacter undariae]MBB3994004.1 hypothetical protein [Sulfitobacter undariae]
MKLFLMVISIILVTAFAASAQQLSVRSGDHPSFSRLTIPINGTENWAARRTHEGIVVTLPEHKGGFDISDVFTRMRRDRITALDVSENSLTIRVDCACDAATFRSGQLLVIDVADAGIKLLGRPLNVPQPALHNQLKTQATAIRVGEAVLPWVGSNAPIFKAPSFKRTLEKNRTSPKQKTSVLDQNARLNEARKSILGEVANAASTGLLTHSTARSAPALTPSAKQAQRPSLEPRELPKLPTSKSPNLRISNSKDRPFDTLPPIFNTGAVIEACPSSTLFDVASWGNETSFSSQIGPARNALMNARDQLELDAAKNLAQLYLYFGFGAEALNTLHLDPQLSSNSPHLTDMANIFEHGTLTRPNSLVAHTNCATDVALWASIGLNNITTDVLIDAKAALRALNRLPTHLRLTLAPALSEVLLQYGNKDAAAAALRSIERLPNGLAPNAQLAQAALSEEIGNPTDTLLQDIASTNSAESPAALIQLVRNKVKADEPLSYQTVTLVEAYAHEFRGTQLGNQLRQTQILALNQSGQFERALTALDALTPSLSPATITRLRQSVYEYLTKNAPDQVFLERTFELDPNSMHAFTNETKLLLASRLMDLGFAAEVQKVLATIPDTPRQKNRQILAARAAITLHQPFQAQASLIGLDGADVALLSAQAKEMSGAHGDAAKIYADNDATIQASRAAWLSDEWRELTPSDEEGFGAVSNLVQQQPIIDDANIGPIARANRILQESGTARATLQEFLLNPLVNIE